MLERRTREYGLWEHLRRARFHEVERINQQINSRRFVGLEGEAGVGKTMLLDSVRGIRTLGSDEPSVVDLEQAWSVGRAAWLFYRAAARKIAGPVGMSYLVALDEALMPGHARHSRFVIFEAFGHKIAEGVLNDVTLDDDRTLLAGGIEALGALSDVVLLIDHLDAPLRSSRHPLDIDELLWQLRSVHQRNRSMRLCLCSRPDAAEIARKESGAFYSDGIWLRIATPGREAWKIVADDAWTTSLGGREAAAAADQRLDGILEATYGQPASTVAMIAQGNQVSVSEAEQRAAQPFAHAANVATAQARSVHRLGAHLLYAIANGTGPYAAVPNGRTEVTRALNALRTAGLVTKAPGRGKWRLTEPMIGRALLEPIYRELGDLVTGPETFIDHETSGS